MPIVLSILGLALEVCTGQFVHDDGDILGVPYGTLRSWLYGQRRFGLEEACAIADYFGKTLDELACRKAPGEYGLDGACPLTDALTPTVIPGEARAMGEDDLAAFAAWLRGAVAAAGTSGEAVRGRCAAVAMQLALTCGLRVGEACALRLGDVACARRDLYVGGTVVEGGRPGRGRSRRAFRQDAPKTRKSRWHVALSPEVADGLARHKAWLRGLLPASGRDSPLLTADGSWLRPSKVSAAFSAVRDELGLDRRLTFHSLRHTHATWLLAEGVDIRTVQERLGHADVATTLRVYGHVLPGRDAAAAEAFGDAMRRAAGA